jgi:methanethiol S-methyltransferase
MQKSNISSVALGDLGTMTQSEATMRPTRLPELQQLHGATMPGRIAGFMFGVVAYLTFCGAFLYAIGFVSGMVVPKALDDGTITPIMEAFIINLLLMSLFAVQHSVMARKPFKRWWTQFVPQSVERSSYVLLASVALILLFWQWRPMPGIVWQVTDTAAATVLQALSFTG